MTMLSDDELAGRLRRTYDAVAASTAVVTPPVSAVTSPRPDPVDASGGRPSAWLLVAASLLLVLGGVGALTWISPDDGGPASSIEQLTTRVRHATLSAIPAGFGLLTIESTADTDTLGFGDGVRELTIRTHRQQPGDSIETAGGNPVAVRATVAEVTGSEDAGFSVRWVEQPGVVVEVLADGSWRLAEVVDIADQIVMVTDETWARLTASAGFATVDDADRVVVDERSPEIPEAGRMDRSLAGSLQTGVRIQLWSSYGPGTDDDTRSVGRWVDDVYIVTATDDDASIRIRRDGITIAEVAAPRDPSMPHRRFASFEARGLDAGAELTVEFLDTSGTVLHRLEVPR